MTEFAQVLVNTAQDHRYFAFFIARRTAISAEKGADQRSIITQRLSCSTLIAA